MKKLAPTIKSPKGFAHQVMYKYKEGNKSYIYAQLAADGRKLGFHVFKKKVNTMYNCESYPGSEAFGVWAWQYADLAIAVDKFKQLEDEQRRTNLP